MPAGQIEVVHPVAEEIEVGEDAGAWLQVHLELQAALPAARGGTHAQFHHALADGRGVGEARRVPNRVVGGHSTGNQARLLSIG